MRSVTSTAAAFALVLGCWALSGCGGPRLEPDEMGEVILDLPAVPGAEPPYPLPELDGAGGEDATRG